MPPHLRRCISLYSIGSLLGALVDFAARTFQQTPRFDAVLDIVTDRCTTSCLLGFLRPRNLRTRRGIAGPDHP